MSGGDERGPVFVGCFKQGGRRTDISVVEGVAEACVEVVAGTDGADGLYLFCREEEVFGRREELHRLVGIGVDEEGTAWGNVLQIDLLGIVEPEENLEVFGGTTHHRSE